jgi:ATP-dependent helicase HrpA
LSTTTPASAAAASPGTPGTGGLRVSFPPDLPISARREEIARAILANQVVIISGETGSGKTTQIPKILLELGYGAAAASGRPSDNLRSGDDGRTQTGGIGPGTGEPTAAPGSDRGATEAAGSVAGAGQRRGRGAARNPRQRRMIAHTQPRRIAARATAERISEELGSPLGQTVGYQVRFTDHSSPATRLKVMTDGVLLAQIQRDPQLRAYDAIIIDEAHERSLNIDFLLGYLSNLLPRRPDLKLIITSATIDSELFAAHFGPSSGHPAPVIEVSGRTYPVEIRYRPPGENGVPEDQPTAIAAAARELMRQGDGDMLVFCSGEREIRDAADVLTGELGPAVEVLPLYSRLSAAEQHRVFERHSKRRIVLATNVAETSLTVPGIHYVIDPGTARISRYSKATKVQRLPIEPISQASANQRAGRCGRVAKGVCIRLYARQDFETRPPFTDPEILRTSLAAVILQMLAVGVVASPGEVVSFPFVQPPDTRSVTDGVRLLQELGAIEEHHGRTRLTEIGRQLARIPLDPRLARMIVEAETLGVRREVTIVTAALTIQDPRERPLEFRAQADQAHARFADPASDFLTYLNLWEYLRGARRASSSSAFRRLVRREYLNYLRIREWQDLVKELDRAVTSAAPGRHRQTKARRGRAEARPPEPAAGPPAFGDVTQPHRLEWPADPIHRALLQGLLSQIGLKQATPVGAKGASRRDGPRGGGGRAADYLGARGIKFAIHPGSSLRRKQPDWIMAAELVETSRLWARVCAAIKPEWAEEAAAGLARRSYAEPLWSAKRGAAIVNEKVLVYGLPVVAARPVPLARIDPAAARQLFIQHALVEGDWRSHHEFDRHNHQLLEQAEELAARARRPGPAFLDQDLFDFYDRRLPESVVSAQHFDSWWKKARAANPERLNLAADLLEDVIRPATDRFPDKWRQGDFELPITYEYSPGSPDDGVTVHIPVQFAAQVRPDGFDWQVPGLRQDLIAGLIKTLPKPLRAELLPAQATARQVLAGLGEPTDWLAADGRIQPLTEVLSGLFRDSPGLYIPPQAWHQTPLADHLRIAFQIEDPKGRVMARGHSLAALQAEVAPLVNAAIERVAAATMRDRLSRDAPAPPPGAVPVADSMTATAPRPGAQSGADSRGAPAPATGNTAASPAAASPAAVSPAPAEPTSAAPTAAQLAAAVREQLLAELALPSQRLTTRLRPEQALPLVATRYPSVAALTLDAQRAVAQAAVDQAGVPGDRAAYDQLRDQLRDRLEDDTYATLATASDIVAKARQIEAEAERVTELNVLNSVLDLKDHLGRLLSDGFISRAGLGRLKDLRRYLEAESYRLTKLGTNRAREEQALAELAELDREIAARPDVPPEVPWMVEELRVSLFAQHLGTAYPISAKRIRRALDANRVCSGGPASPDRSAS